MPFGISVSIHTTDASSLYSRAMRSFTKTLTLRARNNAKCSITLGTTCDVRLRPGSIDPGQTPTRDPDQPDKSDPMGRPGPFIIRVPHYILSKSSCTFVNREIMCDQ